MADKKISELNSATLPLSGTELVPIVQGGETVKVAVSEVVGSQTLQQVTDNGNTTTNPISTGNIIATDVNSGEVPFFGILDIENDHVLMSFEDTDTGFGVAIESDSLTQSNTFVLPDKSGTLAVTSDLTDLMPYVIPAVFSTISFERPYEYGSFTTPLSLTSITDSLLNARKGVVQKIYDNSLVEPTPPIGWEKLFGDYTPSVTNIIFCVWAGGDRVEYWILEA